MEKHIDHTTAIAFDFDGTLIDSGTDKGIHIMCAVWSAFVENGLTAYLHYEDIRLDIDRMLTAYINYPGAPRFQQLSALVNSLINQIPYSIEEHDLSPLPEDVQQLYPKIKESYNRIYSDLNDTAAAVHWGPFPSAIPILEELSHRYDLYIASGVTETLLFDDLDRYSFDTHLFHGIYGGNSTGGSDKASLLKRIISYGYSDVLFVADSNRDLLYAQTAGAHFFRIQEDHDFIRLRRELADHIPDEQQSWSFTQNELDFMTDKTDQIIRYNIEHSVLDAYEAITDIIHS